MQPAYQSAAKRHSGIGSCSGGRTRNFLHYLAGRRNGIPANLQPEKSPDPDPKRKSADYKSGQGKTRIGIEIMEHIANTYGGMAVASYDDQFFTVTIQLNLPAKNNTEKIAEEAAVVCP